MYGVKQPPFHGQFCAVSSIPTQRYQNCRAALGNHPGRKAGTGLELVSLGTVKSRGTVPRPSGVAFAPTAKPPAQGRGLSSEILPSAIQKILNTVYNVKEADNSNQQKKGRQHINHVQIQIAAIQDATSHQENDLQTQQHSKHYWDKHSSNNPETSAELPGAQSW